AQAEQPAVEILALLRIGDVDAEVAQAPDAERPAHDHAAHLELCRRDGRSEAFGFVHEGLLACCPSPHCTPARSTVRPSLPPHEVTSRQCSSAFSITWMRAASRSRSSSRTGCGSPRPTTGWAS